MPLTKRQKEVLDYLVAFETKHGYAPSFEEIGKGLKLTSLATVHKHITTLEKKGFIRRGYNQSRSIEIVQLPKPVKEQVLDRKVQELPRSEEHTSELQSRSDLVCRLLLEKKKKITSHLLRPALHRSFPPLHLRSQTLASPTPRSSASTTASLGDNDSCHASVMVCRACTTA